MAKSRVVTFLPYIIILIFLAFIIARTIDRPIYIWDEGIYANNSLEMAKNNSYFVYTNNDVKDHYNTKPPFVLWLQAASFKIFGWNEPALRIPTFAALIGLLALMIVYSRRLFGNTYYGLVANLFILTSPELMRHHVFLSGELDGVLVFFTTWIFLRHLEMIKTSLVTNRDYLFTLVLFILGYLTKSTAILLIIPGIVISFIVNRQLWTIVRKRNFFLSVIVFVGVVAVYYFNREQVDPGYFSIVWFSEFSRLYQTVMSWQVQPWNFYFINLKDGFLRSLYPVIIVATIAYLFNSERKYPKMLLHILLLAFSYLLMISYPTVKLDFYAAPAYPLLYFALSILFVEMADQISNRFRLNAAWFVIPVLLLVGGYRFVSLNKKIEAKLAMIEPQEREAFMLKKLNQKHSQANNFTVLMDVEDNKMNHYDALNFYRKSFQLRWGKNVNLYRYASQVQPNDTLIVAQWDKIDSLSRNFHLQKLDRLNDCYYVIVNAK